jgi:hypothetical protein
MGITGTVGITDSVSASFLGDTNPQVMAAIQLGRCLVANAAETSNGRCVR